MDELSSCPAEPRKLGTGEIWVKTLISPSVNSYQQILFQTNSSFGQAVFWLFVAGGLGGIYFGLLNTAFHSSAWFGISYNPYGAGEVSSEAIFLAAIGAVLLSVGFPLVTLVNTALVRLAIHMLGGKVAFDRLLYAFAGYQAPLLVLIFILAGIPVLEYLVLPVMVYWVVLAVVAVRAVCQLETGKAILCSLAPILLVAFFGLCAVLAMLLASIRIV